MRPSRASGYQTRAARRRSRILMCRTMATASSSSICRPTPTWTTCKPHAHPVFLWPGMALSQLACDRLNILLSRLLPAPTLRVHRRMAIALLTHRPLDTRMRACISPPPSMQVRRLLAFLHRLLTATTRPSRSSTRSLRRSRRKSQSRSLQSPTSHDHPLRPLGQLPAPSLSIHRDFRT